jgi:filamentous hemagglutinin family protein
MMTQPDRSLRPTLPGMGIVVLSGCNRRGLMSTTALQAVAVVAVLAIAQPAHAQLAPTARPAGGQIVAGQASITQAPNKTTITQTSQNAAVNWQSYNVGSAQTVQYIDPSSRSVTLNRVVGPNPSAIAGHIVSNGTVMIVNQAGLVFENGAQVNAAGLVVSAAGISNSNFMAGKMVFDQAPRPGAKIENHGTITIKDQGLAALVAPQVVNTGVIRANLGKVILAGAEAATLDLYGDGMVSINVTKQVATAPDGGMALVTNTGAISAAGGTVLLTAQAVDGVVQTLVNAGGRISADSVGARTGRVVIAGAGGDVVVTGTVSANGIGPGATGGAVVLNTTGAVALTSTAKVSASGPAGGGVVAVGTTLKRAVGGPSVTGQKTAKTVIVAAGATIVADATVKGNGGRVTVLSTDQTTMAGSIAAKGGPQGGDGGFVEVSGGVLSLTGHVDASAPLGNLGTLLLDPADLYISDSSPTISPIGTVTGSPINVTGTVSWVSPAVLQSELADISLSAAHDVFFASGTTGANTLNIGGHTLVATAGTDLTVDRGFTISAGGVSLTATAGMITFGGSSGVGAGLITSLQLDSLAATSLQGPSGSNVTMVSGSAIALQDARLGNSGAPLGTLDVSARGGVSQASGGTIVSGTLVSSSTLVGSVTLAGTANAIASIGSIAVTAGDFSLVNTGTVTVTGPLTANNVTLGAGSIVVPGSIGAGTLVSLFGTTGIRQSGTINAGAVAANTGSVILSTGTAGAIASSGSIGAGSLIDLSAGTLGIGQSAGLWNAGTVGTLRLAVSGGGITQSGSIAAGTLTSVGTVVGGATLTGTNTIATLGSFAADSFNLKDSIGLTVAGPLSAGTLVSIVDAGTLLVSGTIMPLNGTTSIAIGLTGDALSLGGLLSDGGSGTTALVSNVGTINQTGALISGTSAALTAHTNLDNSGTITVLNGAATLVATTGTLGQTGTIMATTGGTFTARTTLTNTGSVLISAGPAILTATTGDLTQAGLVVGTSILETAGGALTHSRTSNATGTSATLSAGTTIDQTGTVKAVTLASLTARTVLTNSGTVIVTAPDGLATLVGTTGINELTGGLVTAGTVSLASPAGGVTEVAGGTIVAGTLLSGGTIANAVSLLGTANAIGTIGLFTGSTDILVLDTSALTIAAGATVQSTTGNVYIESSNTAGITFGLGGTVSALAVGATVGLQTDALTNLGTTGATGAVATNAGTFELAPHTTGRLVSLGTTGGLSLATLDGITADRVRIGAITLPGRTIATTTAGSITVGGPGFDATRIHVLELDGTADVGQTAPLLNVGALTGTAGSFTLTNTLNSIVTIGTAAAGTLGSLNANLSVAVDDATDLTIVGDVLAGSGDATFAVLNGHMLTVNGAVGSPNGSIGLNAGTIVIAQAGTVIPVLAAATAISLTATTLSQTAGAINAGTVVVAATAGATLSGGLIVATAGSIDFTAPTVSIGAGEMIAALNTATDIKFSNDVSLTAGYVGANGAITIGGLLTESGGLLRAVSNVSIGSLSQTGGTVQAGNGLSSGTGTGVAGWAGSVASTGTFSQTAGELVASGDVNIFTAGTFSQTGGILLAGGTLGVTANNGIAVGGTVSASGASSGFMLLANAGDAVLGTAGLLAGPGLTVTGNLIPGNALQAPAGTVLIAGTIGSQAFGGAASVGGIARTSGYTPVDPAATLGVVTTLPTLTVAPLSVGTVAFTGALIPAVLIGGIVDIERPLVATTLGLYAKSSILEGTFGAIDATRLTGSAGVLNAGSLAAGLTELLWVNAGSLGWGPSGTLDIPGSATLTPGAAFNTIGTLSDFAVTADFALNDHHVLTQIGTLQAGSASSDSYTVVPAANTTTIAVTGALTVSGVIATGIDDGRIRPGGNTFLSSTGSITTSGTIAAVPSGAPGATGGLVSLNSANTLTQTGGVINGGTVILGAPNGVGLSNGLIVATEGPIGFIAPLVIVGPGETIAALNTATGIVFLGDVTQAPTSYVGSNGLIAVGGLLTETGGTLLAVGNLILGAISEGGGIVESGGGISIGTGAGTPGWAGSVATGGAFDQSGGVLASAGAVNIFTNGIFSQTAGTLASGGTLGVTATNGITIAGTISAAGPTTGFMLLANGGDATLATTGLLAGPVLTVGSSNVVPGNALQAPAGTVLIAGTVGTPAFGGAATVGAITPVTGYQIAPPANPPLIPLLTPLLVGPFVTSGQAIPAVLIAGTIDVERPIAATTLGLYAKSLIVEGAHGAIDATTLTGSAGVLNAGTLVPGLTGLGWVNAGTIGWTPSGTLDILGSATLRPANAWNTIGTLSDFAVTQDFGLDDHHALMIASGATVQSTTGSIYIESSNTAGVTFGVGGTVATRATLQTVGLQTDALANLGTPGATGVVTTNGGTFELAPNTTGSLVSLGTTGGLSLATLDGITADRVRIGAVTLPGGTLATTTAGSITVGGTGFDAARTHILELDAIGDVGQASTGPLLNVGTLTGTAQSFSLTSILNAITTIGTLPSGAVSSPGTLGSLKADGSIVVDDAASLTIVGDVLAAAGDATIVVVSGNTLTVNGAIGSPAGNVLLNAGTILIAQVGTVIPVVAGGSAGVVTLTANTVSQSAGVINAGTVTIAATSGATLGGGRIVATAGTVGFTAPSVSVGGGETIAAVNTATDITFSANVDQAASSYIGANRNITVGGLLTENGGALLALGTIAIGALAQGSGIVLAGGSIALGSLSQAGGAIEAGAGLSIGTGSGVAGFAGSAATGGAFNQTGGLLAASGAVNIFTTAPFSQSGGTLTATGTLGVTANTGISIGGTVLTAGTTTGFMLLANAGNTSLLSGGLLAGPALNVSGNFIPGNALQAPGGTVLIAGTIGGQTTATSSTVGAIGQGYTLVDPAITRAAQTSVAPFTQTLTLPSVGSVIAGGAPIPAVLIGGTVDIESPIVAPIIGLYAKSSIVEGGAGSITTPILTGSAGVLRSGVLAPGLTQLGWANAATIGWATGAVDTVGSAALTSGGNAVATLSDFTATGNFALIDAQSLTQTGKLQAGSALSDSNSAASVTTTIGVTGSLIVNGVIATGIDDGNIRPSGTTALSATTSIATTGTIAAVPNGTSGGLVSLNAGTTLSQTAGVINGGAVALTASAVNLANAMLVATTGTIGIAAPSATVSAGEIIAALNAATGISFSGSLGQATSSYIGSNGSVSVASLLTENGGTLLAVGNIALGSLAENGGTIAAGNSFSIGQGGGVAGWSGSSATGGTFSQTGGLLAATNAGNIFTTGMFAQTGGMLATGGTLGVTANQGIDIAGVVSAAGTSTGFMLLAAGGNAVLEASGLLAGAALNVPADAIPGNALQAPAGQVLVAGTAGTAGFGRAGAVGAMIAATGYQITPPASPASVAHLLPPTVGAPDNNAATPVQLSGGSIDIERPVTASTLGLYATTSITEGPSAVINAGRLTGSSGADVNFLAPTNNVGTLGTFANAGHAFNLIDASNLMLTGQLSASSVQITDARFSIDLAGTLLATNNVTIAAGGSIALPGTLSADGVQINAGGPIDLAGTLSAANSVTLDAGGAVDLTGRLSATNGTTVTAGGSIDLAGMISANTVQITAAGPISLTTGSQFSGVGPGSTSPLRAEAFPLISNPPAIFRSPVPAGIYLVAPDITVSANPVVSTGSTINWTFALTGSGRLALGDFRQPNVKLFLDLASGSASGNVNVAGLQVRFTTATNVTVNLTGSVGGISGPIAASDSHISPLPKNNYQINGCPISSVNCIKFTGLTVPVTNPLQDVQMGQMQLLSDIDMILPDVAERDY